MIIGVCKGNALDSIFDLLPMKTKTYCLFYLNSSFRIALFIALYRLFNMSDCFFGPSGMDKISLVYFSLWVFFFFKSVVANQ